MEYAGGQLNFFRLCHIVFDIVPQGLRTVFKQEWDALYTAAHGQWDDTPASYNCFYNLESPGNRVKNRRLLGLMSSGDRTKWDSTCLFYAILYSDSMGPNIGAVMNTSVDDLREIRNEVAHNKDGRMSDVEFKMSVQKIKVALSSLKIDTTKVKEIEKRADFITQEQINNIKKELEATKKELEETKTESEEIRKELEGTKTELKETKTELEETKTESKEIKRDLQQEKQRNLEPQSFCVLPPQPSHDTLARTKEVDELYEEMQQLSSEKKEETTTVYLSGNPGSGKSVIARQVGEKWYHSDEDTLRFVVTLNGSTLDTLLNSYVMFTERLSCYQDCITNIAASKDLSKEDKILQLKALANKQVSKYSSWLIIIDNVVDLRSFSRYWTQSGEKTCGKGQIVVTTQDSPSIRISSYCRHISLSCGLAQDDAIELLCKVSGYRDEDEDIMQKVSRKLDLQPLALSCIAVYMQSVRSIDNHFTWEQCLAKLEKEIEKLEKVYERTCLTYGLSMTAAVNLALEREMNEEIMLHAFRLLSVIAPDPIPLMYVSEYVVKCMADEDRNLIDLRVCSSSLVLSLMQEKKEISIHQVVYRCLMTSPKIKEYEVNVFTVISSFHQLPKMTEEDKLVDNLIATRPVLNHLVKLAKELSDFVMNDKLKREKSLDYETMILLDNCAYLLWYHSMFDSAQHLWQVLLALQLSMSPFLSAQILVSLQDDDHTKYISSINHNAVDTSVGNTLNNLANVYQTLGQSQESIKYYQKALIIKTAEYGENHPSVAETLNNLANVYHTLGQLQESIKYYQKSLTIFTAAYGENSTKVADTLNNLANVYHTLGQLQESIKYYQKALIIFTAAYGENHPSVAGTLSNLANSYQTLDQLQESIKYYQKALTIFTAAYGENSTSIGETLNNLASVYQTLGQLQESVKYNQKALNIYIAVYGENHPSVAGTWNNLGNVYKDLGRLQESIKYYQKALNIYTAAYGENHTMAAATLNNLGVVYQDLCQLQESIKYYQKALTIYKAAFGENHPSVANTLTNLGAVYEELGQLQESIKYYQKALNIYTAAYGENHTMAAATLNNLGVVYKELGQLQESIKYYQKALTIYKAAFGENHTSVGKPLNNLGSVYQRLGQLQESIKYYQKALTIFTAAYGENHTSVGTTLHNLGSVYNDLGQLQESIKYCERALTISRSVYGENHSSVGDNLARLGIAYAQLGRLQASKKYLQKALVIKTALYGSSHPSVGDILENVGIIYIAMGRLQDSRVYHDKAIAIKAAANNKKR